jgi:acetoin utilization deacetylase AcuC-like enzyme
MTVITDERCMGYAARGHPERPARIRGSLDHLRSQKEVPIQWDAPVPTGEEDVRLAHDREHCERVRLAAEAFDGDTPHYPDIYEHAQRSVGGAVRAMELARAGRTTFSLLRPPGHHATRNRAMGFCYFNSVVIAMLKAVKSGEKKVALFDFDVHHGNGSEDILRDQAPMVFCSVHQHPCYPGTGTRNVGRNCFNFPVPPRTPREEYRQVLESALETGRKAKPTLVAVSAGFDAYARDPLAQETLEAEDYYWLGESLRKMSVPVFSVLEGGYSDDLPQLILAYLKGLAEA